MLSFLTTFAAEETGPSVHIVPGEVLQIGEVSITNSMVYAWVTSAIIIVFLVIIARMVRIRPRRGAIQLVEAGTEFIVNMLENSFHSRKKAIQYAPVFTTIFFFILLTNWMGLLPGVGEALTKDGSPVFRPFTADLNGTLAIAIVAMGLVQYFAIRESGLMRHLAHYFNGSLKNPATYLFGLLEIFTEFTRVVSLALRLFLNVVIGEIIIAVFAYLGKFAAPLTSLPFVCLELFVGALQAYIFVMLSATYLAVATQHGREHAVEDEAMA
jgi:F-type H+-transporting ATPase subunit a